MSSVYSMEPPTSGKVVFHTSMGDLEVELWSKEAPKACRSFVQLCMEGYYDKTIFHRVVKEFIVQGGDPTGTGMGGESIYGRPFPDEFHSRLKFSHRGLLAMANTGKNTNTSQFFFTLDRTDELNGQNTIFGKIVGDTLFNLLKIGESEVDIDERPLYPTKIHSVDILHNPFNDIAPRITREERLAQLEEERLAKEREEKAKRPKGKKDLKLLSFADEGEEEEFVIKAKMKSSHDLIEDKRFKKETVIDIQSLQEQNNPMMDKKTSQSDNEQEKRQDSEGHREKRKKFKDKKSKSKSEYFEEQQHEEEEFDFEKQREEQEKKSSSNQLNKIQKEIESMRKEIKSIGDQPKHDQVSKSNKKERKSLVDSFKSQYTKTKKRMNEDDLLASLSAFKKKLNTLPSDTYDDKKQENKECKLHGIAHCESCFAINDDVDREEKGDGWMSNKLVFKRTAANVYEPKVDDYVLIDPRAEVKSANALDKVKTKGPSAAREVRDQFKKRKY